MVKINKKLKVDSSLVRLALFFCFSLAYLVSPYWILLPGIPLQAMLATLTVLAGLLWARFSAGDLLLDVGRKGFHFFIGISIFTLLFNWNALTIDLAWRGDEDDHFSYVLSLLTKSHHIIDRISGFGFLLVLMATGASLILLWFKKRSWFYGFITVSLIAVIMLAFAADRYVEFDYLLRYPYINRWFHSAPVIILNAAGVEATETLYRIIPFLSVCLLAFTAFHYLRDHWLVALLVSFFVVTVPIINYYTTVLYLEMPAVLLFTIALLGGEKLLKAEFGNLKQSVSWYALLVAGFIKETVFPVLIVILGLRSLYRLRIRSERSFTETLKIEAIVALLILLPITTYLAYRLVLSESRSYSAQPGNLFDPELWVVMRLAVVDQMLTPAIFALPGAIVLLLQKRLIYLSLLVMCGIGSFVFFALDHSAYWGYSRFNLIYLPPILVGGLVFFRYTLDRGRNGLLFILIAVAITINLIQRPMDISGKRFNDWGVYKEKTAEYYYPYRDALHWLYTHAENEKILLSGAYYPYKYSFYTDLWNWQANIDQELIEPKQVDINLFRDACRKAKAGGYTVLVYQMTGARLTNAHIGTECDIKKTYRYDDNEIVIYFIR